MKIGYAIAISLQTSNAIQEKFFSFLPPTSNHGLHRAIMKQNMSIAMKTNRQTKAKTALFLDDFFGLRFPTKGSADVKFLARIIAHFGNQRIKFF